MKTIVSGVIGFLVIGGVGTAEAADQLPPSYTKSPAQIDPGFGWSGFYIGGNVDYGWGQSSDTSTLTNGLGTVLFSNTGSSNLKGFVGGGQVGLNWQLESLVLGLESDVQATNEQSSRGFVCSPSVCTLSGILPVGLPVSATLNEKIDWFGTIRGRVGILAFPRVLLYATGGLAYGEVTSSLAIGPLNPVSVNAAKVGYTFGAGVEGAVGGNWTAKFEYLYVDLGNLPLGLATNLAVLGGGALTSNSNSKITDNIWRLGVNYKFGGPPAVRY